MNEEVMKKAGFGKEVEAVHKGLCPTCQKPVGSFKNQISAREFRISGMCQKCQDGIFGED